MKLSATASLVASALTAASLLPAVTRAGPAPVPSFQYEKCYGVNAAGKNDCAATGSHSCSGEARRAKDPNSWIYVPVGTCQKIQGGTLAARDK